MKAISIINLVSCAMIFSTSVYMLFIHYGSSKSRLENHLHKLEYFLVKIGLIFMAMGTLFNIKYMQETPGSQIVLNVGLALFMFWNSIRLNRMFMSKRQEQFKSTTESDVDPKKQDFPDEQ